MRLALALWHVLTMIVVSLPVGLSWRQYTNSPLFPYKNVYRYCFGHKSVSFLLAADRNMHTIFSRDWLHGDPLSLCRFPWQIKFAILSTMGLLISKGRDGLK